MEKFVVILILLTKVLQSNSQFYLNSNFFKHHTIQFITDFGDIENPFNEIFQEIALEQSYSPIVIDSIPNWNVSNSRYDETVNITNPFITAFSTFRPRFSSVISTIINSEKILLMSDGSITRLYRIFYSMVLSNENPDYLYLYTHIAPNLAHYPAFTLTSKIIVFYQKFIPFLWTPQLSKWIQLDNLKESEDIDKTMFLLELNFNGAVIAKKPMKRRKIPKWILNIGCSANFQLLLMSSEFCAKEIVGLQYNYTQDYIGVSNPFSSISGTRVVIADTPRWGSVASKDFNEKYILTRDIIKWAWYIHAITFLPYNYIVIAPKISASFETLILPFDKWAWISVLASVVTTVVMFTLLTTSYTQLSTLKNARNKLIWTISVLFDEADPRLTEAEFRGARNMYPFVGLCFFMSFIIGAVYKGAMYSCLSSTVPPPIPSSLRALLLSTDWPFLTSKAGVSNATRVSVLKYGTIPDLLEGSDARDKMYSFLTLLDNKTIFVQGNKFLIGKNISQGFIALSGNASSISLPIVLIDCVDELKILADAISFLTSSFVVRNNEKTPFITRVPYYGARNFLYPIFSRALGRLMQSGIYDRWDYNDGINHQLKEATAFSKETYRMILTKATSGLKREINFAEAVPISTAVMQYPFAVCAILLLFGFVSLTIEILTVKAKITRTVEFGNRNNSFDFSSSTFTW